MSSTRQITIGLTCVGGHYVYDIIRALKVADDFTVTIVGIDANPESVGQWLVDDFAVAPLAKDGALSYCERLVEVCKKHDVQVLILGSESETRAIASYPQLFADHGIKTTADNRDAAELVTDKLKLFEFLNEKDIDVGGYCAVDSVAEAYRALKKLGYPNADVVFKPRSGTGSRGVLIADAKKSSFEHLLENRFCGTGSMDAIVNCLVKRKETFDKCLAMPYYDNQVFDVDCLAVKGDAVNIIPRLRQYKNPLSPVNEGCKIVQEPKIMQYVSQIARVLNVHGTCDFDIALDDQGEPKVLDASLRMSGSVGAAFAAGANLPAQLVRILLNLPLKEYIVKNGVELRPVNHIIAIK